MGALGGIHALRRCAGLFGLGVGCLLLANCSSNVDPRYGVASSARVVPPGEPVPKGGGVYRVGKPYTVAGRVYTPGEDNQYSAVGLASWYGDDFHGRYTANGEIYDMNSITAASPTMPLPSYARVTNVSNNKSIVVRVNDRGPYVADRVMDVSARTARMLGFYDKGVTKVKVEYIGRAPLKGSDDAKLATTLRDRNREQAADVKVASADSFAPAYFDPQPTAQPAAPRKAPAHPERLYAREEVSGQDAQAPTVELAAATRANPSPPPVSAYAPVRYDGAAGVMSGRGLY
jgi:rare lipoprotein A